VQVLEGGDVMARAKTGTGKTMAFLIPAIEALVRWELCCWLLHQQSFSVLMAPVSGPCALQLSGERPPPTLPRVPDQLPAAGFPAVPCRSPPAPGSGISVLVLSPTRELASQIHKEALALLTHHPFKALCVYGGTNINRWVVSWWVPAGRLVDGLWAAGGWH